MELPRGFYGNVPKRAPTLRENLDLLGDQIRRLKVDYDRFLNGALATPPDEQRDAIADRIRQVRSRPITSFADRFLLNSLEARFNSLSELYNRRTREAETGLGSGGPAAKRPQPDPFTGVVFGADSSQEAAAALYEALYTSPAKRDRADFSSFVDFLERKASKIRTMTGCDRVQFRLDSGADGRLSLKAKPIRR